MDRKSIMGVTAHQVFSPRKAMNFPSRMHAATPNALSVVFGCTLALLSFFVGSTSHAANSRAQIQAVDISRFAYFVDWPADAFADSRSAIGLCLFSAEGLEPLVERATAGLKVGPRSFVVRRITENDSAVECKVLYLGSTNSVGQRLARTVDKHPVLLVANSSNDPSVGAVIIFGTERDLVCFDIHQAAAARDGLVISSKLLGLARKVRLERSP